MTETMTAPSVATDYQAVAIGNIRMMLSLRGLKQSDLAAYMGKHRQNLNRMINTGAQWSFNDMCRAAQFFGVSVDTLLRPDLTQSELRGNGGLPVVNVDRLPPTRRGMEGPGYDSRGLVLSRLGS